MGAKTKIEWSDSTWNPVTGCTKISAGCANCYAFRIQKRYGRSLEPTVHRDRFQIPVKWRKPRRVFLCSMGDLFHRVVPSTAIREIYGIMKHSPANRHTFQVLTKRAERMMALLDASMIAPNIWHGVTVESQGHLPRAEMLLTIPNRLFVSCEPLIGPIRFPDQLLKGLDWVIAGGETGPGAREMKREWLVSLRDQCVTAKVPFFFKRWGGTHYDSSRTLDGRTWEEVPRAKQR